MDFSLFKKCIDDMKKFPNKIKVLRFVGIGEPLLHPRIADMVDYASGLPEKIEMITNGSLLTLGMITDLLHCGLNRMVVSIQGTSSRRYKEVCKALVS